VRITSCGALLLASLIFLLQTPGRAAPVPEAPPSARRAAEKKEAQKERAIQAKDKLTVSVSDLEAPNKDTVVNVAVDEKGEVTLPHLKKPLKAKGLTCKKLEGEIVKAYNAANILKEANVKVVFRKDSKP
jgi:hypothetical protein